MSSTLLVCAGGRRSFPCVEGCEAAVALPLLLLLLLLLVVVPTLVSAAVPVVAPMPRGVLAFLLVENRVDVASFKALCVGGGGGGV